MVEDSAFKMLRNNRTGKRQNNNITSCEAWSLTLREGRRLRVFENRILRRIFGPKGDENVEWRRLHNANFIVWPTQSLFKYFLDCFT